MFYSLALIECGEILNDLALAGYDENGRSTRLRTTTGVDCRLFGESHEIGLVVWLRLTNLATGFRISLQPSRLGRRVVTAVLARFTRSPWCSGSTRSGGDVNSGVRCTLRWYGI